MGKENKKIQVVEKPEIVVHGTVDNPYFEIKYRELGKDEYTVGYGSYKLEYCFVWLKEKFEIVHIQAAQEESVGNESSVLFEQLDGKKLSEMSAADMYAICKNIGIAVKTDESRQYYARVLTESGNVINGIVTGDFQTEDVVNQPSHYQHGSFEVIEEMILIFGIESVIAFCQLNAWKYRARAPYKNKLEEDMAKSNRYLEMSYMLQTVHGGYPNAESYEVVEILKEKKEADNGTCE